MFLLQILGIILTYFGIICLGGIWKLQNRGGHHLTVISSERLVDSASGRYCQLSVTWPRSPLGNVVCCFHVLV